MAFDSGDRVQETTTTTGTGTYTLLGAKTGFQAFTDRVANASFCYYGCTDGTDWEVGIGTFTTSGTTLARTTILDSSNSGSAVSWTAGTRDIYLTAPHDAQIMVEHHATAKLVTAQRGDLTVESGGYRGVGTHDLQTLRNNKNQIASGNYSVVVGGYYNRSSGLQSLCIAGNTNHSSNNNASVINGAINNASGQYSTVINGAYCEASGNYSQANGAYADSRSIIGAQAYSTGRFATTGDAQRETFTLRLATTDDTQTAMTANGSAITTTNVIVLPDDHAYRFDAKVVAMDDASSQFGAWNIVGLISRATGAANTTLQSSTVTEEHLDGMMWGVDAAAETTKGALNIRATGGSSDNIHWFCEVRTQEVG